MKDYSLIITNIKNEKQKNNCLRKIQQKYNYVKVFDDLSELSIRDKSIILYVPSYTNSINHVGYSYTLFGLEKNQRRLFLYNLF